MRPVDDQWTQAALALGGASDKAQHLTATLEGLTVEVSRGQESFASLGPSMAAGTGNPASAACTKASVEWTGPGLKFDVLLRANRFKKTPVTFGSFLPMKISDHLWARCPPWRRRAVGRYLATRLQPLGQLFDRLAELGPESQPPVSMLEVRPSRVTVFAPAELAGAAEIIALANATTDLARSLSVE